MHTEEKLIKSIGVNLEKSKIQIGKHTINYVTAGQGKNLLLVHGGNIGWGQWYPNIKELARHYRVIALDLPGAGRSSPVNFAKINLITDLVGTVESFIKKLEISNYSYVGSSIGGWIGLKLALSRNIKPEKLIVSDALGFTDYVTIKDRIIGLYPFALFLTKTALNPTRGNKNIEVFMRDVFFDKKTAISQEFIDYFYETMAISHNLLFISRLSSVFGMRPEFILKKDLPKIKSKTLIIWGEHDSLMPLIKNKEAFNFIPKAKVVTMKNAGHIPSIEKPQEYNRHVLDFLLN